MKRRFACVFILALLFSVLAVPVSADMGPKPSVNISVIGLSGPCWGTLLSEKASTGPYSSCERRPEEMQWQREQAAQTGTLEVWERFHAYELTEPDGYYFLNFLDDCSDGQLNWTYYPPQKFKVALWFPQEDCMLVTGPYERYAFDSYYTLKLSNVRPEEGKVLTGLTMGRSYETEKELIGFCVRVVLTVLLELAVAWVMGLRSRRQLRLILWVNVATQLLLNGFLNWYSYCHGTLFLTALFLLGELLVLGGESAVYCRWLPRLGDRKCSPLLYAAAANGLSCAAGLWLAHVLPGVF